MKRGTLIAIGAALLLLALVWTFPLGEHLTGAIPYTILPKPGLEIIPLYPGDHLQFYYRLWLFSDSLQKGHPFVPSGYEFNENMGRPAMSSQFFPLSLLYALFAPLGGALAYNLLLLLTFPLTGLFTYLLIRSYGGGFWGGIAGALTAAFMPYRLGQLAGGHPNGFVYFSIPCLLWLLEEYLRTGRRLLAWLAGMVLFSQVFMELHAAFYTGLLMAFYLPMRWLIPPGRWIGFDPARTKAFLPARFTWAPGAAALAVALFRLFLILQARETPMSFPTAVVSALAWGLGVLFLHALACAILGGIFSLGRRTVAGVLASALMPLLLLPLYGLRFLLPIPMLGRVLAAAAAIGTLGLALGGVVRLARSRPLVLNPRGILRGRAHGLIPLALSLAGSGMWILHLRNNLFSGTSVEKGRSLSEALLFTPGLEYALRRVNPAVEFYLYPGMVALLILAAGLLWKQREAERRDGWIFLFFGAAAALSYLFCFGQRGGGILPLYELVRTFPFMSYGRVSSRAMIVFTPAFSIIVGLGLGRLTSRDPARWPAALLGLLAVVGLLADYGATASFGLTRLPPGNLAYEEAARGGRGKIIEVPLWPGDSAWSSIYQYWITRYRHRMVNGYSPVVSRDYFNRVFQPLVGLNVGSLGPDEAALLRSMGVDRLLLHEEVFPPQVSPFPFRLTLQALEASPWLRLSRHDGWVWMFEVLDQPRTGSAAPIGAPPLASPTGIILEGEAGNMNPAGTERTPRGWAATGSDPERPVVRGPDRLYPAGTYRLRLRLSRPGSGPASALLRVGDRAGKVLGERSWRWNSVDGEPADFRYDFELVKPRRLVFEVFPRGDGPLRVEYLYLLLGDQDDPPGMVAFADLPHAGRIVDDPGGAGGAVVLLHAGVDPGMPFPVGPRRLLPPGTWKFTVRYRVGEGSTYGARILLKEVDGPVLGDLRLMRRPGAGWAEAVGTVRTDRELFFGLEVYYFGTSDVWLDRLEVKPG